MIDLWELVRGGVPRVWLGIWDGLEMLGIDPYPVGVCLHNFVAVLGWSIGRPCRPRWR